LGRLEAGFEVGNDGAGEIALLKPIVAEFAD
jgi:hypothetical protein